MSVNSYAEAEAVIHMAGVHGTDDPEALRAAVRYARTLALSQTDGLSFEQLLEIGLCECGLFFDEHPPLRKIGPPVSWHSERHTDQPWRNTITGKVMTPAAERWAGIKDPSRRAVMSNRVCKGCGGDMSHRPTRMTYCSADCYQEHRYRRPKKAVA